MRSELGGIFHTVIRENVLRVVAAINDAQPGMAKSTHTSRDEDKNEANY